MFFNVLSPFAFGLEAETFAEAAKNFVVMQRNLDITRLILADRFKNTMRADIAYTVKGDDVVAGISLMPTIYPTYPSVVSPGVGVGVGGLGVGVGVPVKPAGLIKQTDQGQLLLPINNNNNNIGLAGVNLAPTLAHGYMPGLLR